MADIETLKVDTFNFAEQGSAPATPSSGQSVVYADPVGRLWVKDDAGIIRLVGGRSAVRVRHSTTINVNASTWTSVTFDTEDFDDDAFHSTALNTSRLTVPAGLGGLYFIGGMAGIQANNSGSRAIRIYLDGTTRIADGDFRPNNGGTNASRMQAHTIYALSAGQYVELQVWHDSSTSPLSTDFVSGSTPHFFMFRIA